MTGNPDEIRDVGNIPEADVGELRHMVRKVLEHQIDEMVVEVYRKHHRPLSSTAFDILFQEEIPKETFDALYQEGLCAFLGDHGTDGVDQAEAIEYASKYAFVALIMRYPWLMDPRKGAP